MLYYYNGYMEYFLQRMSKCLVSRNYNKGEKMNKEVESYQGELRDLREENQKLKTMVRNLQEQQRKLLTENK